ncbi:MAG: NifB/NifX family molybdenum-iron cluster-binding protein [Chitinispirillaceae bacterium]|nr:NifB/NifX family molybdenum-iron cluster-binding protein [Chitinispirillaceae bacterium]
MKPTALTVWNGIISPVFDAADTFLIIKEDAPEETVRINAQSPIETAGALRAKNVAVVICGAISAVPLRLLMQNGISVFACIRGNVDDVIAAYRQGLLSSPAFQMPGCGGRGRMCGRRGRGRGGWQARFRQ